MKVLRAHVQNFGSYKELDFQFTGKGLTLIHGPTGAGKSTLCDIIPWVLFGKTAKGGSVDEVRSWSSSAPTEGNIDLHTKDGKYLQVFRTRGDNKDNDLCFFLGGDYLDKVERGKDIPDTQKLINALLGMDCDLYLSGAYMHEFSQTASFFTATPKIRRTITEQLVDLYLAKSLQAKLAEDKKKAIRESDKTANALAGAQDNFTYVEKTLTSEYRHSLNWTDNQNKRKDELIAKRDNFEVHKHTRLGELEDELLTNNVALLGNRSLDTLVQMIADNKKQINKLKAAQCPECGAPTEHEQMEILRDQTDALENEARDVQRLQTKTYQLIKDIKQLESTVNPYREQLSDLSTQVNTHAGSVWELNEERQKSKDFLAHLYDKQTQQITALDDIELLGDVVTSFRGELIKNAVKSIESNTNALMSEYFDSEFSVGFDIAAADKLEVSITKDGNDCAYTQLSKGQRQLLKLCFGLSVMKMISNHHGVDFSNIFLDEALDGLDDNFKLKALRMLEAKALEHSSVFLVEHNEGVKAMISNKVEVRLENGWSVIND